MEITLAKALKQKKRVAAEISKIEADIRANNSVAKNATCEVNVGALLNRRTALVSYMISLKLAINEANKPIMRAIFFISELKSEIALLSSLDTKHGMVKASEYNPDLQEFVATVRKNKAEELIAHSQGDIDAIQETLDTFNYTTKIVLPDVPQPSQQPSAPVTEEKPATEGSVAPSIPPEPEASSATEVDEDGIIGL